MLDVNDYTKQWTLKVDWVVLFARGVRFYLLFVYAGEGPLLVYDQMNRSWFGWKNPNTAPSYPNSTWLKVTRGVTCEGSPQYILLTRLLLSG